MLRLNSVDNLWLVVQCAKKVGLISVQQRVSKGGFRISVATLWSFGVLDLDVSHEL